MDLLKELEGFDAGRQLALIKKLGGRDTVNAILRGDKIVTVQYALQLLFDKHGRRIPKDLLADVCDANRNFQLNQPKLETIDDYINRIIRLQNILVGSRKIPAKRFKSETERLLTLIRGNSQIANIVNGVYLPVILPQLMTDDLGSVLEKYLEAVGESYRKEFGERKFYNRRKGRLVNEVGIVRESRHSSLIEWMKQGSVIGIHFPNSLQGFSINASREQMLTLPKGFILSGMDTLIAMVMYPDILARDYNTPSLDLAAFSRRFDNYTFNFGFISDEVDFTCMYNLTHASASSSSGLLFIG